MSDTAASDVEEEKGWFCLRSRRMDTKEPTP
jgi:hypothetical protein